MRNGRPWGVHVRGIERLHGQRGVVVEAIVVLDRRLMLRLVVGGILGPAGIGVVKRLLLVMVVVVLLVVHLQLAHVELRWDESMQCIRAMVGASALDLQRDRLAGICAYAAEMQFLGMSDLKRRPRACMHEKWAKFLK